MTSRTITTAAATATESRRVGGHDERHQAQEIEHDAEGQVRGLRPDPLAWLLLERAPRPANKVAHGPLGCESPREHHDQPQRHQREMSRAPPFEKPPADVPHDTRQCRAGLDELPGVAA
jgi:hypothetical protein